MPKVQIPAEIARAQGRAGPGPARARPWARAISAGICTLGISHGLGDPMGNVSLPPTCFKKRGGSSVPTVPAVVVAVVETHRVVGHILTSDLSISGHLVPVVVLGQPLVQDVPQNLKQVLAVGRRALASGFIAIYSNLY